MSNSFMDGLYKKYGEDFFKEEVRCEYCVSEKMKKIWAVSLDLLQAFAEVCSRHNLSWHMCAGTLLGAVRHKGFIPWDDDIDIAMPRTDYEKLMEIGKTEFKEPYFFQTPYTDKHYGFSFAKIRNINSTWISPKFVKEDSNMNMGLFIDIFPLDEVRSDKLFEIREAIKPYIFKNSVAMKKSALFLEERDYLDIANYYDENVTLAETYDKIQEIAGCCEGLEKADMLGMMTIIVYGVEKMAYPKSCFDRIIYTDFEGIKVPIPSGYDEILKIMYGDYMKFPPVEQRGLWHSSFCEPELPCEKGIKAFIKQMEWTRN